MTRPTTRPMAPNTSTTRKEPKPPKVATMPRTRPTKRAVWVVDIRFISFQERADDGRTAAGWCGPQPGRGGRAGQRSLQLVGTLRGGVVALVLGQVHVGHVDVNRDDLEAGGVLDRADDVLADVVGDVDDGGAVLDHDR